MRPVLQNKIHSFYYMLFFRKGQVKVASHSSTKSIILLLTQSKIRFLVVKPQVVFRNAIFALVPKAGVTGARKAHRRPAFAQRQAEVEKSERKPTLCTRPSIRGATAAYKYSPGRDVSTRMCRAKRDKRDKEG